MKDVDKECNSDTVFTAREILNRAFTVVRQDKDTDTALLDIIEKNLVNSTSENRIELAIKDIEQLVQERVND